MLFQKRFHPGLRDGSIGLTFRRWRTPKVKVGGRYRFGGSGLLEVVAVDQVPFGEISQREARRSGFDTVEELSRALARRGQDPPSGRTLLTRVRFRYTGEGAPRPGKPSRPPSAQEVSLLADRLKAMEKRSRRGPWIRSVLAWIDRYPQRRAGDLAEELGRERAKLKSDVRRLKALGLTRSFEVGYELTPLGRAVLARSDWG